MIIAGKIAPKNIPALKLSLNQLETYPIKVGPLVHPTSPANANNANNAVPPLGILLCART